MAIKADWYVCNEPIVCNGTVCVHWNDSVAGVLHDIRVTNKRIILCSQKSNSVVVYPLKRIDKVSLHFCSDLNMWTIVFSDQYVHVNQWDWANTLFNNIQYYSVFN